MQAIWDSNNYSTTFANIEDMDVSPGYVISPCAVTRKLGTSYWTYMWWSSQDDVPYHFPCIEKIDYDKVHEGS
jgi:hypothetical protein